MSGKDKMNKTTLFNTLTKSEVEVTQYSTKVEPNVAIVDVLDERVSQLSQIYKPKKTIYATAYSAQTKGMVIELFYF